MNLTAVIAALRPLVGNRVYTRTFLQSRDGPPTWPAIRVSVVSATPYPDACGDGGDTGADFRVQVDIATIATAGETAHQALRTQVKSAMAGLGATYVWEGEQSLYDAETKTYLTSLDYVVYQSG